MNWDQIEGNWKFYRGKIMERWGELTDDDLDVIAGKYDQLIGQVQKKYGIRRKEAELQVKDFLKKNFSESVAPAKSPKQRMDADEERMDSDFGRDKKVG